MVGQDMGMGKLGTQAEKDRRLKKKYVFHPKAHPLSGRASHRTEVTFQLS